MKGYARHARHKCRAFFTDDAKRGNVKTCFRIAELRRTEPNGLQRRTRRYAVPRLQRLPE